MARSLDSIPIATLKHNLVDEQCRSNQLGLFSSVGTVWTFHLEFVGVGEKFGAETRPNLTDLSVGWAVDSFGLCACCRLQLRVIVPARRIEVERDSTVAATLGTAVDTLAPTAGRHVNVVDWGLQVIINGELWHTAPILLFDASEEMASTVRYLDLLIAAALARSLVASVWSIEVEQRWQLVVCLGVQVLPHHHTSVPPPVVLATEPIEARRALVKRSLVLTADDELELSIGITAAHFLETPLASLGKHEL